MITLKKNPQIVNIKQKIKMFIQNYFSFKHTFCNTALAWSSCACSWKNTLINEMWILSDVSHYVHRVKPRTLPKLE